MAVDTMSYNHNSRHRYDNRSPSPTKTDRARATATPTVDNRRRSTLPLHSRSESPFTAPQDNMRVIPQDKSLNDRKTKIQVCIRVRPILPSDVNVGHYQSAQDSHTRSPTPALTRSMDDVGRSKGKARVLVKVPVPSSSRHIKQSPPSHNNRSRNRSKSPSKVSSPTSSATDVLDTQPAWNVTDQNVSQSPHTNPDSTRTVDYTFDHTFGPQHNTLEIYQSTVRDSVLSTMEGYHASVFAYGQTATGKTYTMTGAGGHKNMDIDDDHSKGIVQLAIQDCFNYIYNQKSETREYLMRISFMEIYNEVINDLLASPNRPPPAYNISSSSYNAMSPTPPAPSNIRIFESKNEGVIIRGLKEEIVTCPEQVYALLAAGEKRRQTGSTNLNKQSSRSHSIFRLIVESRKRIPQRRTSSTAMNNAANLSDSSSVAESIASSTFAPETTAGPVRVSTLSLVDLAGSESVKNTGSTGARQKEGQYINKSLLTLGHVVYKLAEISSKSGDGRTVDATHIPYRDSKLTRLLQPSLSGNAQICIICNLSPLARHIEESHLTLKFASRAKRIKQHATITEVVDEKTMLDNYREEIEELKRQLKAARDINDKEKESQLHLQEQQLTPSTATQSTATDEQDAIVLAQAISNLENLILKTTTAEEKKRRKKRKERYKAAQQMKQEGMRSNGIVDFGETLHSSNGDGDDALLNMLDERTLDEDDDLLGGMSLSSRDKAVKDKINGYDDHSVGSLSMGDESTIMEGRKLVSELHRIRGLLGNVLERKGSVSMQSPDGSMRMRPGSSLSTNEQEVERLRAQLHEQAVTTSLRKADSTFLQTQLQEKDLLLKDVSQILEAVENRQVELEAENDRLKQEYSKSLAALRSKDSEVVILEKLLKKRELEIKKLKNDAGE